MGCGAGTPLNDALASGFTPFDAAPRVLVGVQGRFHAFDLARALTAIGTRTITATNYPRSICSQFGLEPETAECFALHGLASRIAEGVGFHATFERQLHVAFGTWLRGVAETEQPDVIHAFSGIAEESFASPAFGGLRTLLRGSAHIRVQSDLLVTESIRAGRSANVPSAWRIEREEREYALADQIFVLSRFAERSFVDQGISPGKLVRIPLGIDVAGFRPPRSVHEERLARVRRGERLRVLFVGAVSYQKGLIDLIDIADRAKGRFDFRAVGVVTPEAQAAVRSARNIDFVGKVPQSRLGEHYSWADVFLFPTIQDGFAIVLCQAAAAGLPLLATENCGAADLIEAGVPGWCLPIRDAEGFLLRLLLLDTDRDALLSAIEATRRVSISRTWLEVAREYRGAFLRGLSCKAGSPRWP